MLVFAHGIVGRADLPIPEALFGAAAAAVLVVSFVALAHAVVAAAAAALARAPAVPPAASRSTSCSARSASLVLALTAYAGLAGTEHAARQPRADDGLRRLLGRRPVRLAAARRRLAAAEPVARDRARRRLARAPRSAARSCPSRSPIPSGSAAGPRPPGVLAFGICELCWATAREPAPLAVLMLVYVVVMLVGMSLYGVEAWTRNADAFGVYFGCFAALAPLDAARRRAVRPPARRRRRADRRPRRRDGRGAARGHRRDRVRRRRARGRCSTTLLPHLQDLFAGARLRAGDARSSSASWSACSSTVGARRADLDARVAGMPRRRRAGPAARALARADPRRLRRRALLLAARLQRPGPRAARVRPARRRQRPVRHGAGATIDYGVVSATAIWYVQVGALVLGHVAGARARARPRARPVREPPRRDPLAARHAGRYGLLHLPRPVAALGGERMTAPPLAHAGHWLAQLAYLAAARRARRRARGRQAARAPRAPPQRQT